MSNVHLVVAPPPSQLRSYAVDLDPSKDEVSSPTATDILPTYTAPPLAAASITTFDSKIADAIATLVT